MFTAKVTNINCKESLLRISFAMFRGSRIMEEFTNRMYGSQKMNGFTHTKGEVIFNPGGMTEL
jgi:hypothetical protein